jgi:phenylalanyl-tRNA synthetase alpha chain
MARRYAQSSEGVVRLLITIFLLGLKRWVEIGNSGMFRPELLVPLGLPEDVNVLGWGLSVERPTMIKYGYDDIRDLLGHKVNIDMVQRNPICR